MKNFYCCFKKTFTSGGFYVCVIFSLILLFSSEIYIDDLTGNKYSIIYTLIKLDKKEMLKHFEMTDFVVMRNAVASG